MSLREKLRRPSLVELILQHLREEILSGQYEPGSALPPERELADRYGVNRTSVKHALMKLESVGLIQIRHGIGSLVVDWAERGGAVLLEHLVTGPLDRALLEDVLEVRVLVGGGMAHLAARRANPDVDERLAAVADHAAEHQGEPAELQAAELAFFAELTSATRNLAFKLIMNTVSASYLAEREKLVHAFEDGEVIVLGLRRIAKAIAAREPEAARKTAEAHLRTNSEAMLAGLPAGLSEGKKK